MNSGVRVARAAAALLLAATLAVAAGCRREDASRWENAQNRADQAQQQREAGNVNAPEARKGGDLNEYFPGASGEFERVAAQEKEGFAEYKLKREGKDVAMLSISDTRTNPAAADKFKQSTARIAGYPAMEVGRTQTAVLVGDRYQVKVLSRDPSFTKADREAWIQRFDLKGLEALR
jgi:hypothetical protein